MATNDYRQFHELAEQFRGEIPLKRICEQEGVPYGAYMAWRRRRGLSPRQVSRTDFPPHGLVEMEASGRSSYSPKATSVHIEFENGLKFDRDTMEVDALVEFLQKIRCALCLG